MPKDVSFFQAQSSTPSTRIPLGKGRNDREIVNRAVKNSATAYTSQEPSALGAQLTKRARPARETERVTSEVRWRGDWIVIGRRVLTQCVREPLQLTKRARPA